jgi:hypothetical protein
VSADPIGIKAGNNLYKYVRDNSINLVDPSGTEDEVPKARQNSKFDTFNAKHPYLGAIASALHEHGILMDVPQNSEDRKKAVFTALGARPVSPEFVDHLKCYPIDTLTDRAKHLFSKEGVKEVLKATGAVEIDDSMRSTSSSPEKLRTGISILLSAKATHDTAKTAKNVKKLSQMAIAGNKSSSSPQSQVSKPPNKRLPLAPHQHFSDHKTKSPEKIIQAVTVKVSDTLRANPPLISTHLSVGQRRFAALGRWAQRIVFGNAVENAIAKVTEDSGLLRQTGHIRPFKLGGHDFEGIGPWKKLGFQITSEKGYISHLKKSPHGTLFGLHKGL